MLLDDMARTGHTLAQAARLLRAAGAEVWSTDCIPHPSNAVSMAEPLARALREVLARS